MVFLIFVLDIIIKKIAASFSPVFSLFLFFFLFFFLLVRIQSNYTEIQSFALTMGKNRDPRDQLLWWYQTFGWIVLVAHIWLLKMAFDFQLDLSEQ